MQDEDTITTENHQETSFGASLSCSLLLLALPLALILISRPSRPVPLWSPSKLPDPRFDTINRCKRGKPSYICDPDGLLIPSHADAIDKIISKAQEGINTSSRVTCANGATRALRIELALMREMDRILCSGCRQDHTDDSKIALQLANELYSDWRVSDPDCENGVLILLGLRDRQLRMVAGDAAWRSIEKKAEEILETAGSLIGRRDRVHPKIRSLRVAQALLDTMKSLTHIDDQLPLYDVPTQTSKAIILVNLVFLILFAVIGLFAAFNLYTIRGTAFEAGRTHYRAIMTQENEGLRSMQNGGL